MCSLLWHCTAIQMVQCWLALPVLCSVSFQVASWLPVAKCLYGKRKREKWPYPLAQIITTTTIVSFSQNKLVVLEPDPLFYLCNSEAFCDSPFYFWELCSRLFGLEKDGDMKPHLVRVLHFSLCSILALWFSPQLMQVLKELIQAWDSVSFAVSVAFLQSIQQHLEQHCSRNGSHWKRLWKLGWPP